MRLPLRFFLSFLAFQLFFCFLQISKEVLKYIRSKYSSLLYVFHHFPDLGKSEKSFIVEINKLPSKPIINLVTKSISYHETKIHIQFFKLKKNLWEIIIHFSFIVLAFFSDDLTNFQLSLLRNTYLS